MTSLLLAIQLSAFSVPLSALDAPDAATATAVAVGLALAERTSIEVAVSIEVAGPQPPAKAEPENQESKPVEWIRTCDPYGCRLVPRVPVPSNEEEATNAVDRQRTGRWRFGRWR